MAFEQPVFRVTLPAGGDLSANQYLLVEIAADDSQVDVASTSAAHRPIGVLQNNPNAAGKAADIMVMGISKVVCSETVTVGDYICPSEDNGGKVNTADSTGDLVIGIALQTGASNDKISAIIFPAAGYKA